MIKLITPLGPVTIYKDDFQIEYNIVKLDNDPVRFPNITGRYKIEIEYESDNLPRYRYR